MRTWPAIEQLAHRVETAPLDRPAHALATALRWVVRPGPVEDVLTGTTLGHPLHPVLIAFPIGSWAAATVLDVARADHDARRMLVGLAVLAAAPTALAGASDWLTTPAAPAASAWRTRSATPVRWRWRRPAGSAPMRSARQGHGAVAGRDGIPRRRDLAG
jgi:hypothetical protein